jgi:hypothetical protein
MVVVDTGTETRLKRRCLKEYADGALGARGRYIIRVPSRSPQHRPMHLSARATAKPNSLLI